MKVVADTNVVVSAIFWPGESRRCLALWAQRRFDLAITVSLVEEYAAISRRVAAQIPGVNPEPWLRWIERRAKVYDPTPTGRQRSRDPHDDPFLACALASGARMIISRDQDLLVLKKPFGIEIVTPHQFLLRFR